MSSNVDSALSQASTSKPAPPSMPPSELLVVLLLLLLPAITAAPPELLPGTGPSPPAWHRVPAASCFKAEHA
eukprot:CAMPEP_0202374008 /NCGR_PEP_ID=MMETSP1127-20130417/4933_1 /ASSEMBLY_ACC=CAM_ASM_000462 /TAXON_ID=3047 /ORGANISM="Dunaliella tertiolecta, Strain CCMP1320" /LENGTH=71 /DNA_ID=CAMNT_0048971067 /DNA_START=1110 /DNA_END=1325 /DNA_ORIENTATION=+